jgi:HEPN/RES N-terminal domain 1/RES domain
VGRAKDRLIQEEEQGWKFVSEGKFVCDRCFRDTDVRGFVRSAANATRCSYCRRRRSFPSATPMNDVIAFIVAGLESEYGDPNSEGVPWEGAEGGWQLPVWDTHDLFVDELGEFPSSRQTVIDDLLWSIGDRQWCERNPFRLSRGEVLNYGWEDFCEEVKHRTRFVFFTPRERISAAPERETSEIADSNNGALGDDSSAHLAAEPEATEIADTNSDETISPSEMLYVIGDLVSELGLITEVPTGTEYARARPHGPGKRYSTVSDLCPPPKETARANRMNPAGVPMFYGAADAMTAVEEVRDQRGFVSVGYFSLLRELSVLDLTRLPPPPGIYNQMYVDEKAGLRFLNRFVRDATKTVVRDESEREHIDYVPTQVVTEFFRHIFVPDRVSKPRQHIDGILYPSSKRPEGVNCVLFCDRFACEGMAERSWDDRPKWLRLVRHRTVRVPPKMP